MDMRVDEVDVEVGLMKWSEGEGFSLTHCTTFFVCSDGR